VNAIHMRILAEYFASGRVVQFAQPLTEVDDLLGHLRLILVLLGLGGIALAALLGQLVARAAVLPVRRLTRAAEHVAETQDLSGQAPPPGRPLEGSPNPLAFMVRRIANSTRNHSAAATRQPSGQRPVQVSRVSRRPGKDT
jgi:hypothetical protein